MICRACGILPGSPLCRRCAATLQGAAERRAGGVLVRPALLHAGAARVLVHRLKYGAVLSAAEVLAAAMARRVPPDASCLVPVPRVAVRRWRYGVDPAAALCAALATRTALPVVRALRRPLWWARRAGRAGAVRGAPRFRRRGPVPPGAVLVDDVVTTGATLAAAAEALGGVRLAVTATGPTASAPGR